MSDERIVEVMAEVFRRLGPPGGSPEHVANLVVAALRADGFEMYRPDDCMETLACAHCITASIPLNHGVEPYHLVPMSGETPKESE